MHEEPAERYEFAEDRGTLASMNAGQFDGQTIKAGETGEIAEVEIGEASNGEFSEYQLIALGGVPDPQLRTKAARLEFDLQGDQDGDGAVEDVPAGTKLRLQIRKKRGRVVTETRWFDKSEYEAGNIENLPVLEYVDGETIFGEEGRVITVEVRNPSSDVVVSLGDSTGEFPIVGAF